MIRQYIGLFVRQDQLGCALRPLAAATGSLGRPGNDRPLLLDIVETAG